MHQAAEKCAKLAPALTTLVHCAKKGTNMSALKWAIPTKLQFEQASGSLHDAVTASLSKGCTANHLMIMQHL